MTHTNSSESAAQSPPRLLRLPAVLDLVGLGRTSWLDLVRDCKAPRPVKIGRATVWVEAEIAEFVRERIRASREKR